jgi:hypothetical protein
MKLRMAAVRVVKLGIITLNMMKVGTAKTVRPIGETG